MIVPPRNLLDVLANLRSALYSDDLLKQDFYSEQNIEAISGGHDVQWTTKTSKEQSAWVADFSPMIAPVTIAGWVNNGIDYSIGSGVRPAGQRWARARVVVNQRLAAPNFDAIERIFGKDWNDYDNIPSYSHRVILPPTDPRGNASIRYVSRSHGIERSTILEFAPDGTLNTATFSEETE